MTRKLPFRLSTCRGDGDVTEVPVFHEVAVSDADRDEQNLANSFRLDAEIFDEVVTIDLLFSNFLVQSTPRRTPPGAGE